jgi:hypothetical protein
MNEYIVKLEQSISDSWRQLQKAVESRSRMASQTALDRVSHLESLKEQQLALEKSITASLVNGSQTDMKPFSEVEATTPTEAQSFYGTGKRKTIRPKEIRFGSVRKHINYANEIPIIVANWLIEQGKAVPNCQNFIHPSNSGFSQSAITKRLISGQFIEVGDNQEVLLHKARKLLDACGHRGMQIEVLLVDGNALNG